METVGTRRRGGWGREAIMPSPGIMNIKDAAEVGRPVLNNPVKRWRKRQGVRG